MLIHDFFDGLHVRQALQRKEILDFYPSSPIRHAAAEHRKLSPLNLRDMRSAIAALLTTKDSIFGLALYWIYISDVSEFLPSNKNSKYNSYASNGIAEESFSQSLSILQLPQAQ
jgi:hypothetical protein